MYSDMTQRQIDKDTHPPCLPEMFDLNGITGKQSEESTEQSMTWSCCPGDRHDLILGKTKGAGEILLIKRY